MKSWIATVARCAQAAVREAYQYIDEEDCGSTFYLNGDRTKKYNRDDLRAIRECIDRLIPRKKK